MASLNPYLNFMGNTEEAFNFYKSVFGGEFFMVNRFKDQADTSSMPEGDLHKIMHIALPVGKNMLMGTDVVESMGQKMQQGNAMSIAIDADSDEEGQQVYNGLAEGGQASMPYAPVFWGGKWGMLTDKFGVQWMVSYNDGSSAQ